MLSHGNAEVAPSMQSRRAPNDGIRSFAEERRIKAVFHFTRLDNVPGILTYGLLTRAECDRRQLRVAVNDLERLDRTDAVCASIGFPNYKMFYRLRCSDPGSAWAVLRLSPAVLWETRCAFCATNAASARVTAIPIELRQKLAAFRSLFEEEEGKRRKDLGIPEPFPTDPQAEVLLLDGAGCKYIESVFYRSDAAMAPFQKEFLSTPVEF